MHKKINDVKLDGFAISSAAKGETVRVATKDWATSELPLFYIYAEQIGRIIFPKLNILNFRDVVNNCLIIIHPDNTADVYDQDFKIILRIKPNRSIKKGELVYGKDVAEITEVHFPDIAINPNDKVIFFMRSGWRFGVFFDFTKKINSETLASDIAKFQEHLVLEDVLENTLAKIRSQEAKAGIDSHGAPKKIYEAFIITEGKTDVIHLKTAFKNIAYKRKLKFSESEEELGDTGLLKMCELAIHSPSHKVPVICIFDRDNEKILKKLMEQSSNSKTRYQVWGNNFFSFALPVPTDRKDYKYISIEMYYPDEVIGRATSESKRLFFDNELVMKKVLSGNNIILLPTSPIEKDELTKKVYSKDVENIKDSAGHQVGLSKTTFAEAICSNQEPFKKINFNNFKLIAGVIDEILKLK